MAPPTINPVLLHGKSYELFYSELKNQLALTQDKLSASQALTKEDAHDLAVRYHRLKGSAGFFGLHEMRESARTIESTIEELVEESFHARAVVESCLQRLVELFEEIPKPQPKETHV